MALLVRLERRMRGRRSKHLYKGGFGSIRHVPMSRAIGHRGLGQPLRPPALVVYEGRGAEDQRQHKGWYGQPSQSRRRLPERTVIPLPNGLRMPNGQSLPIRRRRRRRAALGRSLLDRHVGGLPMPQPGAHHRCHSSASKVIGRFCRTQRS
jgi:hypothetical protein